MNSHAFPSPHSTALIVVDVQEKLVAAMPEMEIKQALGKMSILIRAAGLLGLRTIVTEQYPKGLGNTLQDLRQIMGPDTKTFEKTSFSCFGSADFTAELKNGNIESLVIIGVEAHVCVQQTAFDAVENGFSAFVPADAVSSRDPDNRRIALDFMARGGVAVTSSESFLFSLMRDSKHPEFKNISRMLK